MAGAGIAAPRRLPHRIRGRWHISRQPRPGAPGLPQPRQGSTISGTHSMKHLALSLLALLATMALDAAPVAAQNVPIAADPALAQQPQPDLVKLLPPDAAKKPFTVAVALGSPPDDFRNEKGEIAGWEVDILRAATQSLGLE